jgi:WD40 repeat protein
VGNEFSSDGQRFLLINRENYELSGSKPLPPFSMQVYDAATGAAFPLIRLRAKFNNAHLSPDGQSVVSFSDNEIQFWNAATGERCAAQLPVARGAKEVALSLDGSLLALASAYQSVTVYRLQPMGRLTSFEISSPISALAFSPDNSKLVVGTEDGLDQIWDVKTGKPLSYPMNTGAATDTIAFSRDGKIVLTTSLHSAQIWETSDGNALGSPINVPDPANIDQTSIPLLAALSPDGRELWLAEFGGPLEIHHLLLGGDLGMDHDPVENLAILVSGFQAPANGDTVLERIAPRERLAMAEEFRKQFNIPQDQDLIPAMVKILAARK